MGNRRRRKFVAALAGAICPVVLLLGAYIATRPVASCAPAAHASLTSPPAALTTAHDYFAQGDYDFERGDCNGAISNYSRAIELDSSFAEAYNNRAYIHMLNRDYAAAPPDLDRALQLRPGYVNALMNRGDLYNFYFSIDRARAVADYDRVLQVDPTAASHTSVCGHRLLALNHG